MIGNLCTIIGFFSLVMYSFIIQKKNLTEKQIYQINTHIDTAIELSKNNHGNRNFGYCEWDDAWSVDEKTDTILVSTSMDNFDMGSFLKAIEISNDDIKWDDY